MHIGMVSATYDDDVVNGVLRMVQLYRTHLQARGHEVTVFALGAAPSVDLAAGIVRSPGLPLGDLGYYAGLGYTREAQRLLATADIVHCHHLFMSLELAHRYVSAPIVYTNHTRYDLYTGSYTHLPQPMADAIMRYAWPHYTDMADAVIAPSTGMERVMGDFGVRTPITRIENGIEREQFISPESPLVKADLGIPNNSVLAIYCGRLSAEKDIDKLVHLFSQAARRDDRLHLLLIGKGPLEAELQQLATGHGLNGRLHLTGKVPYDEVANYLAAGDLFITASTSEVHPLTVIEAMAAGLPVIAIRSPGMEETIDSGITGFLVESADDEFVEAILTLAQDAGLRERMGSAAQIASGRYDINRTVDQTLTLYEDLLAERPDKTRDDPHGKWPSRISGWESRLSDLTHIFQTEPLRETPEP